MSPKKAPPKKEKSLVFAASWWKDLDIAKKLPFARDRSVECYFWILGIYFEPQYFPTRKILNKVIALTSIIDDIYDSYGTLEELELFTDTVERSSTIDQHISKTEQALQQTASPSEYMKLCYQALLDVYNMIDEEMRKQDRSYCVHYAKSTMKILVRAYFEEVKWFHQGYVPTMEEYMSVTLVTGAHTMLATTSFVGMGEVAFEEAFDWVSNNPLIVQASSVVGRLMDDMVGHKFEQKRGHVVSAVECYMKQHGATEEEVLVEFRKLVTNAWKDINAAYLRPTAVPMPLLLRVVNLTRMIHVIYKDEDGYTHSGTRLKAFVTSVLSDRIRACGYA
ncbi:hypothetical protein HYC85_014716 [Camellia sinensis]|uniref:Terpene synthase metal-binding domain-containing protein n=1 Tax=Camellia sinensis TaxID=4442 RepID=A0A7J7H7A3_CAMSI|nr:hypothetical protein HYC85_014716 [Camellia sinensis]